MLLAIGVLAGLLEARGSGRGQVVDAAMTDGAALLMSMMYTLKAMGQWQQQRGSNLLDGGAHFYDTYQCRDGRWISVGAIEAAVLLAAAREDRHHRSRLPAAVGPQPLAPAEGKARGRDRAAHARRMVRGLRRD